MIDYVYRQSRKIEISIYDRYIALQIREIANFQKFFSLLILDNDLKSFRNNNLHQVELYNMHTDVKIFLG